MRFTTTLVLSIILTGSVTQAVSPYTQVGDQNADNENHADGLSRLFSKTGLKYNKRAEKHASTFNAKDSEDLGFEMRKMFGGAEEHDEGEIMRDMFGVSEAVEGDENYSIPEGLMVSNILHNNQVRVARSHFRLGVSTG